MKQKNFWTQTLWMLTLLLFLLTQCKSHIYYLKAEEKSELSHITKGNMVETKLMHVYPGKTYRLQQDGAGKPYPVIYADSGKTLIVIELIRNLKKPLPDSGQAYKLYIPVPNPLVMKKGKIIIPPQKILFGLQAFMAGAGYKPLQDGTVVLFEKKNKVYLSIKLKDNNLSVFNGTYRVLISDKK